MDETGNLLKHVSFMQGLVITKTSSQIISGILRMRLTFWGRHGVHAKADFTFKRIVTGLYEMKQLV